MASAFNLAHVLNGGLYLWRAGRDDGRRLARYRTAIINCVERLISRRVAGAVSRDGLEAIHRHVSAPDLRRLTDVLSRELQAEAEPFVRWFLDRTDPDSRPIFVAPDAWMRFMAPESSTRAHADEVGGYYGHLVAHDPHRDSWFSQAVNVVNLWIAVGHVAKENGLLLYPDQYGKPLDAVEGRLSKRHALEAPLRCVLEPGDVLIFHGEHLHSSALNLTNRTRVVLSFRFTVGQPRFAHYGERYRYRRLAAQPKRPARRCRGVIEVPNRPVQTKVRPTPVSTHTCAVRLSNGVRYFDARCPHRGADLRACGHVDARGSSIVCAWHGVAFDLQTGKPRQGRIGSLRFSTAAKPGIQASVPEP